MKAVSEAFAETDKGFANCAHGRRGSSRQILLMDAETLERLAILPGVIKENIVTRGLAVQSLPRGQRLRIGEALLEVTIPC
ncbi:MAG TPA: MOSC domain-containing protein, partial [Candidatus Nitrosotenuis sp.]|nr:MOSC domain-containing protein [Candidatus Nitrosotenuis sp.]